jgi:hypothetical protein
LYPHNKPSHLIKIAVKRGKKQAGASLAGAQDFSSTALPETKPASQLPANEIRI